ncbi:hypothetical protein MNBD_GAMMA12-1436 [hydrothermal vent metagenome]|uniref:Leucine rich repeat variant n=1 Tax=hydrothermal vent metagenome TaxID=652676 RepID=A0A3B0Y2W4_9ZZZZ
MKHFAINTQKISWLILLIGIFYITSGNASTKEKIRKASHPSTTIKQLSKYSSHRKWRVRKAVAMNRRASTTTLYTLASDTHVQVRIAVATNLSTDEKTFLKLSKDKKKSVRSVVARFEYVPSATLQALAKDKDPEIRLEVAKNPNTDKATLEKLLKDEFPEIRNAATVGLQDINTRGS